MSIHGDRLIRIADLKNWVNNFNINEMYPHHLRSAIADTTSQVEFLAFKNIILRLNDSDDWRSHYGVLSPNTIKSFFQVAENAIYIANYYECFIIPADVETKKKLIKGFNYSSIGAVHIDEGAKSGASIGEKSDLMWSVFYDYFIREDGLGGINHVYGRHEEVFSIQLYDVAGMSLSDIEHKVKEILLKCSIESNLHFKIEFIDRKLSEIGDDGIFRLKTTNDYYEQIPAMYFSNAIGSSDIRVKYLSYYQVLEYFFVRSQNIKFIDAMNNKNIVDDGKIKHRELRTLLKQYNKTVKESESLKLVIKRSINAEDFVSWIKLEEKRVSAYCTPNGDIPCINLDATHDRIISKLAERIYYYRCAIAHAKGDVDEYIALPYHSDKIIYNELPLLRYVATAALKICSEI